MVGAVLAALAVYDARGLREAAFERLADADTAITVTTLSSSAAQSAAQTSVVRSAEMSALGAGAGTVTAVPWSNSENLPAGAVPGARPTDQDLAVLAGFGSLGGSAKLLKGSGPAPRRRTGPYRRPCRRRSRPRCGWPSDRPSTSRTPSPSGGVRIRIVGIYRPLGSEERLRGAEPDPRHRHAVRAPFFTYGPFDVDPAVFAERPGVAEQTSWDIQPSPLVLSSRRPGRRLRRDRHPDLRTPELRDPRHAPDRHDAALAARRTGHSAEPARAELAGVALILLALTIAALIITARPLGAQREAETYLLALRGRSRRQAALANVGEAATLGVVTMLAAAPAGTLLAVFLGRNGPLGTGGVRAMPAPRWRPGPPSTWRCHPATPGWPCWASRCSRPPS